MWQLPRMRLFRGFVNLCRSHLSKNKITCYVRFGPQISCDQLACWSWRLITLHYRLRVILIMGCKNNIFASGYFRFYLAERPRKAVLYAVLLRIDWYAYNNLSYIPIVGKLLQSSREEADEKAKLLPSLCMCFLCGHVTRDIARSVFAAPNFSKKV